MILRAILSALPLTIVIVVIVITRKYSK